MKKPGNTYFIPAFFDIKNIKKTPANAGVLEYKSYII